MSACKRNTFTTDFDYFLSPFSTKNEKAEKATKQTQCISVIIVAITIIMLLQICSPHPFQVFFNFPKTSRMSHTESSISLLLFLFFSSSSINYMSLIFERKWRYSTQCLIFVFSVIFQFQCDWKHWTRNGVELLRISILPNCDLECGFEEMRMESCCIHSKRLEVIFERNEIE